MPTQKEQQERFRVYQQGPILHNSQKCKRDRDPARKGFSMPTDLSPSELMKAMGSKKGFDPIPPDQHAWTMADSQPPLFRLWGYMCAQSIRKEHRQGYAVDAKGKPITIEKAAADLKMDPALCRRTWRQGMAIGLWRKGTNANDRRYLYLNGEVVPVALEPDEEADADNTEKDCTILFAPYISKQIKELPKKDREVLISRYTRNLALKKEVHADLTAANRLIFDQREDSIFADYGVKKIREERSEQKPKERTQRVLKILPGLESFVQSLDAAGTVQSQDDVVQTQKGGTVHTGRTRATVLEERSTLQPSSSSAVSLQPEARRKAEEENSQSLYQIFKTGYPTGHFDEGKTRPAFEKRTRDQQCAIIERLKIYLDCERWKSDEGRWIPLASTWLKSYEADPPPAIPKKAAVSAGGKDDYLTGVAKAFAERIRTGTL